jgi:CheY-like chemotaxis protein
MAPRVLVVDDSATLREVMSHVLRNAGMDVDLAHDGADALDRLQSGRFDLLITDFVMPRLNGYQLVQTLRTHPTLHALPVVLVSAKAEAMGARFLAQTGTVAALAKPFTPEALRSTVARALAGSSPPAPPTDDPFAGLIAELAGVLADVPPAQGSRPTAPAPPPSGLGATAVHRTTTQRPAVVPSATLLETAHARFTELLARELTPAFHDVAAGASTVTEESVVQLLRFYLSPPKTAALFRELRPLDAGLRGNVVLDGLVEAVPLGEVFQLLALQAQTGVLTVERGADMGGTACFALRGGRIDLARAHDLPEEFLLGRYLVEAGVVSRAHIDAVLTAMEPRRMLLGTALLTGGFITESELSAALRRQTEEIVYEALRWPVGRFRFEAGATIPEAQLARLDLPSEPMVLEGYRRLDEWRLIGDYLPGASSVPARLDVPTEVHLDPSERRVLEAIDGRRTVTEVAAALAMSSFDVSRTLCRLLQGRLITLAA